jgi:hypothetical protein
VPAILAGIVADHPLLGTKAVYPNIMMQVATANWLDQRTVPLVTSSSQVIAVAISPFSLIDSYDGVQPVDNIMVFRATVASLQALDLILGEIDPISGQGWYEQVGQGCLLLFEPRTRRNVLGLSPVYNATVVQQLFTKLRSAARVEHLPPLTPAQIRNEVMSIILEFNFSKFNDGYPDWQSQNPLPNIQWQDVIRRDTSVQQAIQPTTTNAFAVASVPTSVASVTASGAPPAKKAKTKTNTVPVSSVTSTAGVVVTGGGSGRANATALSTGQVGKSCKFHVKHLYLQHTECSRGVDCHFYHQKKIRKGATARDELLAWAAVICVDDPDYDDLVNAIKNRS